jgi:hypothetical protein
LGSVDRERDDLVAHLTVSGVVFANTDDGRPIRCDTTIRETPSGRGWRFRADWHGFGTDVESIQALISPVGEIDSAVEHPPRSPAVLMDSGAGVEAFREKIGTHTICVPSHDLDSSSFRRSEFGPPHGAVLLPEFCKRGCTLDDEARGNR